MPNYKELSDLNLWELFCTGDKYPLEIFYLRYYDLLLNFGLKIVQDEEMVKDSIQDLFVKLYVKSSIETTKSVRSYLLKSLQNLLYDELKKTDRWTEEPIEYVFSIEDAGLEDLFQKSDLDVQNSQKLLAALKKLNSRQKMTLYLRYVKGLSYKEIADVLQINEQSSVNLSFRTLQKLRKLMLLFF